MAIKSSKLVVVYVLLVHTTGRGMSEESNESVFLNDDETRRGGIFYPIQSQAIMTDKITSKTVNNAMDCAFACLQIQECISYNLGKTAEDRTFICETLKTNQSLGTSLKPMSNYTHYYFKKPKESIKEFTHQGHTGRTGIIQEFVVPNTGSYVIEAGAARGGTLTCSYGSYPGTYLGGKGATIKGTFFLTAGTVLKIVVGQRGGDAVEVKGGQGTTQTAASLGLSVEDNAGTGGGGGSFVYTSSNTILLAAGGGGGAAYHSPGVDGQITTSGSPCSKEGVLNSVYVGGVGGAPGHCNSASGNYHGGVGAGWNSAGCARKGINHGETGGSRLESWVGGRAGKMNSGNNGGPPPGAVGGFGGGGGGSEDNGASGGGGGYSGGGSGIISMYAGGGGGSFCGGSSCSGTIGGNPEDHGFVKFLF